jgi:hypothetical protein
MLKTKSQITIADFELPVQKRRYHSLLSFKQTDKSITDYLYNWLDGVAGIPIWYDAHDLPLSLV